MMMMMMMMSIVGTGGSESGLPENCVVAADITLISLSMTNNRGFRPPS